jgi:hypothetical protein
MKPKLFDSMTPTQPPTPQPAQDRLERALSALRKIRTWARGDQQTFRTRASAMKRIKEMAEDGLGEK